MKRIFASALALAMLAVPVAQAQAAPKHYPQSFEQRGPSNWHGKPDRHVRKKVVVHKWKRGAHVPSWQRKQVVRDYHRHGLKRPARGQHWIRVDNQYLLIGITSGVIAGLIAAR